MYRIVDAKFWLDQKVRTLPVHEKMLFLYCFTNPHTHLSGLYSIPIILMVHETKMEDALVRSSLRSLESSGVVSYDHAHETILVTNMLSYQGRGKKIVRNIEYHLQSIESKSLIKKFLHRYSSWNIRYPIDTPSIPHASSPYPDPVPGPGHSIKKKGGAGGKQLAPQPDLPHQTIINRFLELKGTPRAQLSAAQVSGTYKRHSRSALALITEAGGLDHATAALECGAAYFDAKHLTWTLDTIAKHLPHVAKWGEEIRAHQSGFTPAQVQYAQHLSEWLASQQDGHR